MTKPKECINFNCKNIMYVEEYQLHLPLQCQSCIDKKQIKNVMRTETEKQEMISKLEGQKEVLPEFSFFGDNNWNQIDAAIDVIENDLDSDEIYDKYEFESDVVDYAHVVREWLDGADNEDEIISE